MKYIIVVIRKDLNFKKGPIITQACHAVSALVYENRSSPLLQEYFSSIKDLRKITYKIPTLDQLLELRNELSLLNVKSYEWIENPENITTCIAFGPLEMDESIRDILEKYNVKLMLNYSKEEMYEIVRDIAKYKEFIPGIKESKILTACESDGIKAELVLGVKGIESRFVSLVVLDPHHTISATSYSNDVMGNLGFKSLSSKWEFQNGIGGKGTLVKLQINLEFNNFIMGKVTGMMVDERVGLILNAFENRAKKLYSNTQKIKGSISKD